MREKLLGNCWFDPQNAFLLYNRVFVFPFASYLEPLDADLLLDRDLDREERDLKIVEWRPKLRV